MGQAWFAEHPKCPVHGTMKLHKVPAAEGNCDVWVCPGWDGEGCPEPPVRDMDLEWQRLDSETFELQWSHE